LGRLRSGLLLAACLQLVVVDELLPGAEPRTDFFHHNSRNHRQHLHHGSRQEACEAERAQAKAAKKAAKKARAADAAGGSAGTWRPQGPPVASFTQQLPRPVMTSRQDGAMTITVDRSNKVSAWV